MPFSNSLLIWENISLQDLSYEGMSIFLKAFWYASGSTPSRIVPALNPIDSATLCNCNGNMLSDEISIPLTTKASREET